MNFAEVLGSNSDDYKNTYKRDEKTKLKAFLEERTQELAALHFQVAEAESKSLRENEQKLKKKVEYLDEIDTLKSLRKSITIVDELKNAVTKTTV